MRQWACQAPDAPCYTWSRALLSATAPLAPRAVDDAYTDEVQAAMGAGIAYHFMSYEQLVHEHDRVAMDVAAIYTALSRRTGRDAGAAQ